MENDKIFVGSGRVFGNYGQIGISVCLDDIPEEHVTTGKNGKRYVRLNISQRQQVDQYGNTHSVDVNTWKPENQQ